MFDSATPVSAISEASNFLSVPVSMPSSACQLDQLRDHILQVAQRNPSVDMYSVFIASGFLSLLTNILKDSKTNLIHRDAASSFLADVHKLIEHAEQINRLVKTVQADSMVIDIDAPLCDLDIPMRILTLLNIKRLFTVRDVIMLSERDFMHMPGFGSRALNSIKVALAKVGLKLKD